MQVCKVKNQMHIKCFSDTIVKKVSPHLSKTPLHSDLPGWMPHKPCVSPVHPLPVFSHCNGGLSSVGAVKDDPQSRDQVVPPQYFPSHSFTSHQIKKWEQIFGIQNLYFFWKFHVSSGTGLKYFFVAKIASTFNLTELTFVSKRLLHQGLQYKQ